MTLSPQARAQAQDMLDFIDASPSPWHVIETVRNRLLAKQFTELFEQDTWQLKTGGRYFVVCGASSIIAFVIGNQPMAEAGMRIVGAHTDSPGLRLKPCPAHHAEGMVRLGVEIYGGPILATFADRDLSLAGRVNLRVGQHYQTQLLRFDEPLVRLPNLAIHMNREVNEQGLKLHKQNELPLILGLAQAGTAPAAQFYRLLADRLGVKPETILNAEFNVYDTQKGVFWGEQQEFIANSQLDNLASCHAALSALLDVDKPGATALCALFDHEEVGSGSAQGADGSFAADVIRRIQGDADAQSQRRMLANSFFISADMAHGWHPNFPNAYDPHHHALVNHGPVIKHNANQRYSTGLNSAARFMQLCEKAGVPCQQYVHRTDLGCGSTIGPMLSAQLGINSVDVGCPMWAMHSLRESAGVLDHGYMIRVLEQAYAH